MGRANTEGLCTAVSEAKEPKQLSVESKGCPPAESAMRKILVKLPQKVIILSNWKNPVQVTHKIIFTYKITHTLS